MEKHLRHLPKTEKGDTCLNCGHKLSEEDNFCPRCSQINDTKRFTFLEWIREILGDFLAYDSRLVNSLKPLFTNPGQLSIDYIKGKRASHIHPIRLYLVTSFILFLLISANNFKEKYITPVDKTEFTFNDDENASIYSIFESYEITDSIANVSKNSITDTFMLFLLDVKKYGEQNYKDVITRYNYEDSWTNRILYKKAVEYSTFTFDKLSKLLQNKLPLLAFAFLPIFVIFINLLYYKKDILYLEHLVFAFHTQSVLFLMLSVCKLFILINTTLGESIQLIVLFLIFPFYLFKGLKKFYEYPSKRNAIKNFIVINLVYLITAFAIFVLSIFIAFFSY